MRFSFDVNTFNIRWKIIRKIALIQKLGLSPNTRRYNINLMGCYAALTGMRLASEICNQPNRTVLLVSVELCTLHFQQKYSDDYLLSNTIFADGAASAIITSEQKQGQLELMDFESRLLPDSDDEMSWKISPDGFLMTLSSDVPKTISKSLNIKQLFDKNPTTTDWAIHPGGKQIIDGLEKTLGIATDKNDAPRKVLNEYGNMSSATILFVLKELLANGNKTHDELIACAFGPGLTLEAALLAYV